MRSNTVGTFVGIIGGLAFMAAPPSVSATEINLTTMNADSGSAPVVSQSGDTFYVVQIPDQTTGTGVIDPFLRLQANGDESGYNTSLGTPLDDKGGPFTRSLLLSEVPVVGLTLDDGTHNYYQFMLDINQNSGSDHELLSLNQIQIFQASSDQLYNASTAAASGTSAVIGFPSATEVFRMSGNSGGGDVYLQILLNYALNAGSGSGDMFLYLRTDAFSADPNLDQVILFSQFGTENGTHASNDGFEEWAVIKANTQPCIGCDATVVPEPGSLLLLGSGLSLAAARLRRRRVVRS